ncbi:MAG: hypothetical protein NTW96_05990, partial [Planctomycetia bacterium]|nr:hypothetical protein [Planctomycetia bacterium]
AEPGPEAAPAPAESVGRFISDDQVVLRLDPATKSWTRLPAQGILPPDSELLSLPTFRPLILLTAGMTVQLTGATRIRLQPKSEQKIPELAIEYGRMVVRNVGKTAGKPDTKLSLNVGGRKGLVTFVDPESALAVEMGRTLVPGTNPETQPPPTTANVYAVTGRILWDEGAGGEPLAITGPGRITLDARPLAAATAEPLPRWLTADTLSQLDRWASATLAESLQADRPVVQGLRELVDHRKKEVGGLAVRSLGCVGDFDPMLAVLIDRARKLDWSDTIQQLRSALALDPGAAAAIRAACEKAYGTEGDKMFRMFWGYTDEQLAAGEDKTLFGYLDHDLLAFRVVSFWNLRQITGAGLYYEPEATAVIRRPKLRAWKERQEAGEIRHKATSNP